jgi:hypothetical protein
MPPYKPAFSRRDWLTTTGTCLAALVSSSRFVAAIRAAEKSPPPKTIALTNPHLFLDNYGLAVTEGITFRIHPPRSEGITLAPERDWEAYRVSPLAVIEDGGKFKMWYQAIACHPGSTRPLVCPRCRKGNPGSKVVCVACGWPLIDIDYLQNEMIGVCYAESTDGIRWERPNLGLVNFRGSKQNNLIVGPCGVPALNPKGAAGERFMGIVEHKGQLYVTASPDGLRWTRKPKACLPFAADTNNQLIYDAVTDRYVALLRGFPGRRTTVRCEFNSLDQAPWPFAEHGHKPDGTGTRYITDELPTALDIDADDQRQPGLDINHISASPYLPGAWFAFPALFRKYPPAGLGRAGREGHRFFAQGNDGTWETQLAVSRDGRHWSRPDRTAYLGPGLFGGPDGGLNSLYGIGLIRRGDEVYQYGSGQSVTHGIFEPGERRAVGAIYRFVQPRDRFIAAAAGPRGGRLVTHPFAWPGGELILNIDCGGLGDASVELRAIDGQPLPGFSAADCDRVDLNHLAHTVTWRGKTSQAIAARQNVRMEIRLNSAKLYAMEIRSITK